MTHHEKKLLTVLNFVNFCGKKIESGSSQCGRSHRLKIIILKSSHKFNFSFRENSSS